MTSKFGEGYFAGSYREPTASPDALSSSSDVQAEFMRKIQEVARSNEDFGEIVKRYMDQNGHA